MVMEKSWNFVISHEISPILPPNFTNFVNFLVTARKLSSNLESLRFLQNVANVKSRREMVMKN